MHVFELGVGWGEGACVRAILNVHVVMCSRARVCLYDEMRASVGFVIAPGSHEMGRHK